MRLVNCSISCSLGTYEIMSCKKGLNWTEEETRNFLELCIDKQILSILDGRKHKHIEIFRILVPLMKEKGYSKTGEQMKLKLKNLKLAYFKCRRDNNVSGAATTRCPFYNELDLLYGCRPSAEAVSNIGLDTAGDVDNNDVLNNDGNTIQECDAFNNDVPNSFTSSTSVDTSDQENIEPPAKKIKTRKIDGRKSYEAVLDKHTEKWFQLQKVMMETIIQQQDKTQKELIQEEMEKQREWEKKEMEKERTFQREQTGLIMQTFLQSIQALKPQIP